VTAPMLSFAGVSKRFGVVQALHGVDMQVMSGGLTVLLGPAGAGKTTALRLAAGLDVPDRGAITVAERDMVGVPPRLRPLSMVFDSLALYPDRTAAENLAYPLRVAGWPAGRIAARVDQLAALLRITHTLRRLPRTLSGGERQRVALGRAMARGLPLMLLDEPLSSLDALLRLEMRAELRRLQADEGQTVLMATPDQAEALAIADEVVVLLDGKVRQSGPPQGVYDRPASRDVARLLGAPPINLLPAEIAADAGGRMRLAGALLPLPPDWLPLLGGPVRFIELGIRPEHLHAAPPGEGLPARLLDVEPLGPACALRCAVAAGELTALAPPGLAARLAPGDALGLIPDTTKLHPFGADGARLT